MSLQEVRYGEHAPKEELASHAQELLRLISEGALDRATEGLAERHAGIDDQQSQLFKLLVTVKLDSYRFKSEAFREEREWRLLATSRTEDVPAKREHLRHRATAERIVPYSTLNLGQDPVLLEVVLGPKHLTPCEVVEEMLELNDFPNVPVKRSSATYR